eukprot:tig00000142_g8651.t1
MRAQRKEQQTALTAAKLHVASSATVVRVLVGFSFISGLLFAIGAGINFKFHSGYWVVGVMFTLGLLLMGSAVVACHGISRRRKWELTCFACVTGLVAALEASASIYCLWAVAHIAESLRRLAAEKPEEFAATFNGQPVEDAIQAVRGNLEWTAALGLALSVAQVASIIAGLMYRRAIREGLYAEQAQTAQWV